MMNEVLKVISERYSCRDFTGEPLSEDQIEALVNAALAAPSGMNLQPWRLIVLTDKALIEEMDDEGVAILAAAEDKSGYERIMSRGGKAYYNAPCMILILSDGSYYSALDCGILCENVALAASSLGLGNVICGMAALPLGGPRKGEWEKRLGFPEGYKFCISVLVGAAKSGKQPHELDQTKVHYIK